jgi:hypothetical protein
MSQNGYLLLLLSVAILTAESFQLAPTTTRSSARFTQMSNNGVRNLRTAFATAALTFAFNADFGDNNRMLSFTPSPVHARGAEYRLLTNNTVVLFLYNRLSMSIQNTTLLYYCI